MSYRDLCVILVGVVLAVGIGTAVLDWQPALVPTWRVFLISTGVVLIVLLVAPAVRNRGRHRSRKI